MADRIKTLRQARGMTQEQLADYCGVTKSAVSQWENGSTANIKLQPLMRLVEALRTDHAYLIYGQNRRPDGDLGPARKNHTA
jgi:transcriptional regulator with XRE-family HTH domain